MIYPKAILFDLDDTIITEGVRAELLLEVAEGFAGWLAPLKAEMVAAHLEATLRAFWSSSPAERIKRLGVGWNIRQARETLISDGLREIGVSNWCALAIPFCERFADLRSLSGREFPAARSTIEALKIAGIKLALVTNGPADFQRAKVERFNLAPLFDHIQIEGEHGFGKPDAQAYTHAMSVLGVTPDQTWMVGDNLEWEVAAPQRLGIYAIWHDHEGRGLPVGSSVRPNRIIKRLAELLLETH